MKTKYIVMENWTPCGTAYVAARPGWMRCANGKFARDGDFCGGPEWTHKRERALEFTTHRAAARVASKCPSAVIVELS